MAIFRRHLRFFAAAWVLFQATSLSALVPRACCLAHQAAAAAKADCHEHAPAPDCEMSSADGAPCGMHHMHGSMHEPAAPTNPKPINECAVRGMCGGPLSALFAIFSTQGILTDSIKSLPDVRST